MKDFISKLTFGFLMAQVFPGVVCMVAITNVFRVSYIQENKRLLHLFEDVSGFWFTTTPRAVMFVMLSIGAGMLIHGIHWAVLAWLENRPRKPEHTKPPSSRDSFWHGWRMWKQVLVMPVKLFAEVIQMLYSADLDKLTMDENLPSCKSDDVPKFTLLHDFYLHFGQFYAHTAYALAFAIPCYGFVMCQLGWTTKRVVFLGVLYLLCSVLFLLGRIHLGSLFKAELKICGQ